MPKFREISGQFVAYVPDGPDPDIVPDRATFSGRVTFTPVFTGGLIAFPNFNPPEFVRPERITARIIDGFVKVEVTAGEDQPTTQQSLSLMVTVDDEATQVWSWRADFEDMIITGTDEYVSVPAWSFRVPDGVGPVDLTELVPLKSSGTVDVTKGPRGAGLQTITAIDGQLVFEYTDGEETVIPMPDAVQGPPGADGAPGPQGETGEQGPEGPQGPAPDLLVGNITDATPVGKNLMLAATEGAARNALGLQAGATAANGSLAELNAGTLTSSRVWSPRNLADYTTGKTREAMTDAWQPDLLNLARERSPYERMTVTQNADQTTTVTCHADDQGGHTLQYTITTDSRYRIIGEIREGGGDRATSYTPALDDSTEHAADQMLADATLDGEWNTSSTYYTVQVGACWEAQITTTSPGDTIALSLRRDTRGGIWKMELVEDPSVSALISCYAPAARMVRGVQVFSIPTPGTYTIRGTFMGDDPDNPPSETARGWLASQTWTSPIVRVSKRVLGSVALSPKPSNKNWALRLGHPDAGTDQFFPHHGQDVETVVGSALLYDGVTPLDLAPGQTVEVESFTMVQHLLCHDDDFKEEELVEVRTADTIYPDGTYRATGRVEVLEDVVAGVSTYFGMLPINPQELNKIVTPFRTAYPATPDMTGNTNVPVGDGLHSKSLAAVGDNPDLVATVRFNTPEETRRLSVNGLDTPMFIQHRDSGLAKIYPRIGYGAGTLVPAGTVWRFSVDYWLGRVPGIKYLID